MEVLVEELDKKAMATAAQGFGQQPQGLDGLVNREWLSGYYRGILDSASYLDALIDAYKTYVEELREETDEQED